MKSQFMLPAGGFLLWLKWTAGGMHDGPQADQSAAGRSYARPWSVRFEACRPARNRSVSPPAAGTTRVL